MLDARVLGHHEVHALREADAPHHELGVAFEHLDDGALATAALIGAAGTRQHLVAVEDLAHLASVQVQVLAALGRHQEAVALAARLHLAAHQVHARYRAVGAAAVAHQLPVALHRAQAPAQRLAPVLGLEVQLLGQFVQGERYAGLVERGEDELAARDRVVVACGFVGLARVALAAGFLA